MHLGLQLLALLRLGLVILARLVACLVGLVELLSQIIVRLVLRDQLAFKFLNFRLDPAYGICGQLSLSGLSSCLSSLFHGADVVSGGSWDILPIIVDESLVEDNLRLLDRRRLLPRVLIGDYLTARVLLLGGSCKLLQTLLMLLLWVDC